MSAIPELMTAALTVFDSQTQLHYKRKRLDLTEAVRKAKNEAYPNHSRQRIADAQSALDEFDKSFAMDFGTALGQILKKISQ